VVEKRLLILRHSPGGRFGNWQYIMLFHLLEVLPHFLQQFLFLSYIKNKAAFIRQAI
jgi:hypothetical protein